MSIGKFRVAFLQMTAIRQQDPTQFSRRRGGVDRSLEPIPDQERKISRVVKVRMRQDHGVNLARLDWQRGPVLLTQLLETLKQAAIDKHPLATKCKQIL